jgi:ribosomal protein L30E
MAERDELSEIKKLTKSGRLVIGTENSVKKLKADKLEKIWLSSNVPPSLKDDISRYGQMGKVKVVSLGIPNDELGVQCKKQFSVSVVSLLKGEK